MRSFLVSAALAAGAMIVAASPAAAQQTPPTQPPSQPQLQSTWRYQIPSSASWSMPHGQHGDYEMFLTEASGNNVNASLERVDLANRVSVLMELGKCDEARAVAREAGDLLMALRARQLCRQSRD